MPREPLVLGQLASAASPGNAPPLPLTGARIVHVSTEPQLQTAMGNLQSRLGQSQAARRVYSIDPPAGDVMHQHLVIKMRIVSAQRKFEPVLALSGAVTCS
jgi:hypothetical protein